jgi:outer membrane receptor protein involved in Fe transport
MVRFEPKNMRARPLASAVGHRAVARPGARVRGGGVPHAGVPVARAAGAGVLAPIALAALALAAPGARAQTAPAPAAPTVVADAAPAPAPGTVLDEITVTARKKNESAIDVPVSITAFSEATIENLNINSFADYATKTPNMSFSYGTANWGYVDSHTIAIRGISGFGTTGVYIDDTPVPDSLDPRVVDISRIEILKGPQGTLFGQSSLGGNLRLITVQPTEGKPDAHFSVKGGQTSYAGSPDYSADFAGSHDIARNLVGRLVGFYDHEGGFLRRVAVDPTTGQETANVGNYGAQRTYGGSGVLRWTPDDHWEGIFRFMMQDSLSDGWSAPYAPLPNFSIQSFTMDRTNSVQENAHDRFILPSLQVNYSGDGYSVHESLSFFNRIGTQIEDGSEGTRDALDYYWAFVHQYAGIGKLSNVYSGNNVVGSGAINEAFPWTETVTYRRTTSETRVNFDKNSFGLSGVAGVYLSRSFSDTDLNGGNSPLIQQLGLNTAAASNAASGGTTGYCRNPNNPVDTSCPSYGTGLVWASAQPSTHYDEALFGELYYAFSKFELTAGARAYRQTQTTHELEAGALNYSYLNVQTPDTKQTGLNPKLALKYNFDSSAMVYASYAKGFRAGGAGVPLPLGPQVFFNAIHQSVNTPTTYTSDFVHNFEVGGKVESADRKYDLTAAVFQMNWSNIQQTIIAPESYITMIVNAGDARVRGAELEGNARPVSGLELHAGVGFENAEITNGSLYWQPTGSPVYNTPKVTANAAITLSHMLTDTVSGFITIDGSYTGSSYSGTAGCELNTSGVQYFPCPSASATDYTGSALRRAGFSVFNARIGADWGPSELALYGQNLLNARPNLGDFNPESYAKHSADPAQYAPGYGAGYIVPRVATLRPFSMGLIYRYHF